MSSNELQVSGEAHDVLRPTIIPVLATTQIAANVVIAITMNAPRAARMLVMANAIALQSFSHSASPMLSLCVARKIFVIIQRVCDRKIDLNHLAFLTRFAAFGFFRFDSTLRFQQLKRVV